MTRLRRDAEMLETWRQNSTDSRQTSSWVAIHSNDLMTSLVFHLFEIQRHLPKRRVAEIVQRAVRLQKAHTEASRYTTWQRSVGGGKAMPRGKKWERFNLQTRPGGQPPAAASGCVRIPISGRREGRPAAACGERGRERRAKENLGFKSFW